LLDLTSNAANSGKKEVDFLQLNGANFTKVTSKGNKLQHIAAQKV
jgi:hypothetical protein